MKAGAHPKFRPKTGQHVDHVDHDHLIGRALSDILVTSRYQAHIDI